MFEKILYIFIIINYLSLIINNQNIFKFCLTHDKFCTNLCISCREICYRWRDILAIIYKNKDNLNCIKYWETCKFHAWCIHLGLLVRFHHLERNVWSGLKVYPFLYLDVAQCCIGAQCCTVGDQWTRELRGREKRALHGYQVGRGKLMNGGDLLSVNKCALGSGNRGTRGEERRTLPLSFQESMYLIVQDDDVVESRFLASQANHVASRRRP